MGNELFLQITQGNEQAFEAVFRANFKSMCFYARLLGLGMEAAAEVTQLTFIRFWERRLQLKADGPLDAYLYTALRNNCLDHLRQQKNRSRHEYAGDAPPETAGSGLQHPDWLAYKELEARFYAVLATFPPQMKQVFVLSRIEGLKYKEIADRLDISVKTVETQVSRALVRLRTELKDYMPFLLGIFFTRL